MQCSYKPFILQKFQRAAIKLHILYHICRPNFGKEGVLKLQINSMYS